MKTGKIASLLCGVCAALCLAAGLLSLLIDRIATAPNLMQYQLETWAPSEDTGLPAEEYPGMAAMITRYLAGTGIPFQYTLTEPDGEEVPLFHDYEQAHMADCLSLFTLDRTILLISFTALPILLLLLWWLGHLRQTALGFAIGIGLTVTAVLTLIVWGCVDFVSLFLLFHRVSFGNMLWILNPQTDMLIRLMPTAFFISYAGGIAVIWLLLLLTALIAAILLCRKSNKPTKRKLI